MKASYPIPVGTSGSHGVLGVLTVVPRVFWAMDGVPATTERIKRSVDNDAPIGVNGPLAPRAAEVTGASHSGSQGSAIAARRPAPALNPGASAAPGRACRGRGATNRRGPVVGGRWANARGLPAGRSLSCNRGLAVEPGFVAVVEVVVVAESAFEAGQGGGPHVQGVGGLLKGQVLGDPNRPQ